MRPHPIEFQSILKRIIWGGRRLGNQLGKPLGPESDYAESWEVVDHGADQSLVQEGPLQGQSLSSLVSDHADWLLGSDADSVKSLRSFPLLLKYLDCNRVLSVQVHPDDEYGLRMEKPDLGKTEAWYIVDADPDSLVYAGLKAGVDRQTFAEAIHTGRTAEMLHSFHPDPGDIVFIPAGTVHALGAGLLVAEIQQSSDTTFRVFDWDRVGDDGKSRQLHVEQALEVTDYASGPVEARRGADGEAGLQSVVCCDKFVLKLLQTGEATVAGDDKFHILTVPRGKAVLQAETGEVELTTGSTLLLPAAISECNVTVGPDSVLMAAHLPA